MPVWVAYQLSLISYPQMAFAAAGSYLVQILFELPSGAIADLLGRRKTMIIGWLVNCSLLLSIGLTQSGTFLIVAIV